MKILYEIALGKFQKQPPDGEWEDFTFVMEFEIFCLNHNIVQPSVMCKMRWRDSVKSF